MSKRVVVVEHRGCLWYIGTGILVGGGFAYAVAWPTTVWHGTAGGVAEGIWLGLLFIVGSLAFIGYSIERGRKARASQTPVHTTPGPRDWSPAEDDGRRVL